MCTFSTGLGLTVYAGAPILNSPNIITALYTADSSLCFLAEVFHNDYHIFDEYLLMIIADYLSLILNEDFNL